MSEKEFKQWYEQTIRRQEAYFEEVILLLGGIQTKLGAIYRLNMQNRDQVEGREERKEH